MTYNVSDSAKPFDSNISTIIIQIWNDPEVSKLIDEQAGKFYLMDSAT
jgi:hypothetical protein